MKKALLLFIFIIPLTVFSQSKISIDGFLNMPFGSDSATVKKVLLSKGATENYSLTEKDILVFKNFIFNDRIVFACLVKFVNNKAFEADFLFSDFTESGALSYYDSLSSDIAAVYGNGEFTSNFRESESSSTRIRRLKSGEDVCKTLWQSENNNVIALEFQNTDYTLSIKLIYQDEALLNTSRAKKISDF
jgi:hypothetical protein